MNSLMPRLKPEHKDEIREIMDQTGYSHAVVTGVLGDIARMKHTKESQAQIVRRWGIKYGDVSSMRGMGKITIADVRESMATKSIILASVAQDELMDRFNDDLARSEMGVKDLIACAKQMTDSAINLENNSTGGSTVNQVNIGEIKMLIQHKEQRGESKSAIELLKSAGLNVEKIADAEVVE